MFLYILYIYLTLYFNVHIVVGYYYCVGIPRWVLDHLLGYVWEVPLGGRNPKHLGIYFLPLNFLSSLIPLYFILFIYMCVCVCVCVCVCKYIYIYI